MVQAHENVATWAQVRALDHPGHWPQAHARPDNLPLVHGGAHNGAPTSCHSSLDHPAGLDVERLDGRVAWVIKRMSR
jgi:hypothetical protein